MGGAPEKFDRVACVQALIDKRVVNVMTSDYMRPAGTLAKKGLFMVRSILNNPLVERAKILGNITVGENANGDSLVEKEARSCRSSRTLHFTLHTLSLLLHTSYFLLSTSYRRS